MKLSLVVSTFNRTEPLGALLASLASQTMRDFEVLIVDQNTDARIDPILRDYEKRLPINRLTSARGASRGRNAGIVKSSGQIIAFPDDDCRYPSDLLARVADWMDRHPEYDGLSGRAAGDLYWATKPGPVSCYNVWKRGIEYAMFFRRALVETVGGFDETLGPGAGSPWAAGEGTDYLLRAMSLNFRIYYDPTVEVVHPPGNDDFEAQRAKAYGYALGKGRVLRLRQCPAWFNVYQCARPLAGAGLALLRGSVQRAKMYSAVSSGIRRGWLATKQ